MLTHLERMKREKEEHDACGIIAAVEKNGIPSHENVLSIIDSLI
ncbi:MAG: hypothetical protein JWN30_2286, partial [Bacilli bacterium]|nr:hypothetical protein [Bacilli bacterium]